VTAAVIEALRARLTGTVGVLDAESPVPLVLDVDEPLAVGADRIANALAALELHPGDSIVVDFGTATTFDCVTADRRFIGGSIMPGLRTSADQLIAKAAKLTATELRAPERAIGRTTAEHLQGGILFGTADAIDGMIGRIRAEWPGGVEPKVIATGGLASLIAPLTATARTVDLDLTLHGLRLAADAMGLPA
jgi:type III pantothenate kinase